MLAWYGQIGFPIKHRTVPDTGAFTGVLDIFCIATSGGTARQWQLRYRELFSGVLAASPEMENVGTASGAIQASMVFGFMTFVMRASAAFDTVARHLLILYMAVTAQIVLLLALAVKYRNMGVPVWRKTVQELAAISALRSSAATGFDPREQFVMKGEIVAKEAN